MVTDKEKADKLRQSLPPGKSDFMNSIIQFSMAKPISPLSEVYTLYRSNRTLFLPWHSTATLYNLLQIMMEHVNDYPKIGCIVLIMDYVALNPD